MIICHFAWFGRCESLAHADCAGSYVFDASCFVGRTFQRAANGAPTVLQLSSNRVPDKRPVLSRRVMHTARAENQHTRTPCASMSQHMSV